MNTIDFGGRLAIHPGEALYLVGYSRTLQGDAACSRICIQLSLVLFAGSLLFLLHPALWWADGAAALVLSGFIGREGLQGLRAAMQKDFSGGCGCH